MKKTVSSDSVFKPDLEYGVEECVTPDRSRSRRTVRRADASRDVAAGHGSRRPFPAVRRCRERGALLVAACGGRYTCFRRKMGRPQKGLPSGNARRRTVAQEVYRQKRTAGSPFRDQGAGRGGRDLPAADRPDRGSGHGVRSVRKPSRARQRILRSVADVRRTAENRRLFRIPVFRACSRRCARRAGRLGRMRVGTGGALVPGRRFTVFIIRSYPAKFGNRSQKSAIFAFGTPSKKLKCES